MEADNRRGQRGSRGGSRHGLVNQGATCYLNSVLQVLFWTPEFREKVIRHSRVDSDFIDIELSDLFKSLKEGTAETVGVTRKLGIQMVNKQQDSAEYFEMILSLTSPEASQVFRGQLTHRTLCEGCNEAMDAEANFWHLPLPLVKSGGEDFSVVQGMEEFFQSSRFSGDNQVYCNNCDDKRDAVVSCEMKRFPAVLTLLLKRFEFSYTMMGFTKNNCCVTVPHLLHIPQHQDQTYELFACIEHEGSLKSGHYTATIRCPPDSDQRWFNFNDRVVHQLNSNQLHTDSVLTSRRAYLLFYQKKRHASSGNITHGIGANTKLPCEVDDERAKDEQLGAKYRRSGHGERIKVETEREKERMDEKWRKQPLRKNSERDDVGEEKEGKTTKESVSCYEELDRKEGTLGKKVDDEKRERPPELSAPSRSPQVTGDTGGAVITSPQGAKQKECHVHEEKSRELKETGRRDKSSDEVSTRREGKLEKKVDDGRREVRPKELSAPISSPQVTGDMVAFTSSQGAKQKECQVHEEKSRELKETGRRDKSSEGEPDRREEMFEKNLYDEKRETPPKLSAPSRSPQVTGDTGGAVITSPQGARHKERHVHEEKSRELKETGRRDKSSEGQPDRREGKLEKKVDDGRREVRPKELSAPISSPQVTGDTGGAVITSSQGARHKERHVHEEKSRELEETGRRDKSSDGEPDRRIREVSPRPKNNDRALKHRSSGSDRHTDKTGGRGRQALGDEIEPLQEDKGEHIVCRGSGENKKVKGKTCGCFPSFKTKDKKQKSKQTQKNKSGRAWFKLGKSSKKI